MSVTSRATIRAAVAALLPSALGIPAGNVLEGLPGAFRGASPLVAVLSAGSHRPTEAYGTLEPHVYLDIRTYVLLSMPDGTWTEANAEATIDALEAGVASVVLACKRPTTLWHDVEYAGRSRVEDVITLDGFIYRRETIPLMIRLLSDS